MGSHRFLAAALLVAACAPATPYTLGRAPPRSRAQRAATQSSGSEAPSPASPDEAPDGAASFYSDALAGNTTANGESYDPAALTAAHRTLRFGTRVRVRREDDGRSVEVCINDRGPYVDGRVIDLSRAAATRLGMIRAGVVDVSLEVVGHTGSRRCE
jgi:rare lipoprotein A